LHHQQQVNAAVGASLQQQQQQQQQQHGHGAPGVRRAVDDDRDVHVGKAVILQQQQPPPSQQQRVFTGTVTKMHDNFGFVDEDVFFQMSVVKGQPPRVNVMSNNN
jgi:hypothetical protein